MALVSVVFVIMLVLSGSAGAHLPGAGMTLVTGRGESTGGKTFLSIGELLHSLLGTVVSRYYAHDGWGAYTVWLLHPRRAR